MATATARMERRLAAILAADVVGYSSLVERDEDRTLARLKAHRREFIESLIAEYQGRIVKLMGDGILAEFASVVDAVRCAVLIQRGMAEREAGVPDDQRIRFRIGINLGDVIREADGDLYGDGVNVAARLEQLAEPGEVVVSGMAFDQLRGGLGRSFAFLGERRLKNIERPVRAYRMAKAVAGGSDALPPERPALPLPDRPSLAVLPFDNLSGDPEQGYFADGIVEDLVTALSRVSGLFVIARNSSFAYRGKAVDVRQVGRELGVRYVLEGSVRRAGERVRIAGQLIEAATGAHLWADRFDGTLEDVFDLQDRVAAAVAGAIEPTLRRAEVERARRKPTESLDAYDLHLRALPLALAMTPEANREALRLLDRALALDPDYALASAAKSWCHGQRYQRGWAGDDEEAERQAAERAARHALAVGGDDPAALALGGFVVAMVGRDCETGLDALRRALALNPNSALALGLGATVHCLAGDYASTVDQAERALRLSPLDLMSYFPLVALAYAHLFSGRADLALEHAGRAIRVRPGFVFAYCLEVAALVHLGRLGEARAAADRLVLAFPTFDIAQRRTAGFRDTERYEAYIAALREAGLPEKVAAKHL